MQNKPNFKKSRIRLTIAASKTYAKMDTWSRGKNKPNSKPAASAEKRSSFLASEQIW